MAVNRCDDLEYYRSRVRDLGVRVEPIVAERGTYEGIKFTDHPTIDLVKVGDVWMTREDAEARRGR
jgi:hypothetical protein